MYDTLGDRWAGNEKDTVGEQWKAYRESLVPIFGRRQGYKNMHPWFGRGILCGARVQTFSVHLLTLFGPQSRFGDRLLEI